MFTHVTTILFNLSMNCLNMNPYTASISKRFLTNITFIIFFFGMDHQNMFISVGFVTEGFFAYATLKMFHILLFWRGLGSSVKHFIFHFLLVNFFGVGFIKIFLDMNYSCVGSTRFVQIKDFEFN